MTSELLVNLLAAGIAFLVGVTSRSTHGWLKRKRALAHEAESRIRRHPRYSADWLIRYYRRRGADKDLYVADHGSRRQVVPFLTKPSWYADGLVESIVDQQVPHELSAVPVDTKVLAARGRYLAVEDEGGEPWNELLACAAGVTEDGSGPRVRLVLARYFQYLSACGPIEDETYAAIAKPSRATPLRDRVLPDVDVAARCSRGAHAFGMQVATVFDTGGRHVVLIQRRSFAVSIYGGALAVVPVFGCQSVDLSERTPVSLFHNYLREVYEELYGGVEVQRRGTRVDPTWFYREAPIARLLAARERGDLEFTLLGFGFDALNAEMDLCALAYVSDRRYAEEEIAVMTTNWEIQDIAIHDLWGSELTDLMLAGEFSPGSVFTLARAREVLADRRHA
ncbi:hypothetical protein [Amycolatopsis sp. NPDC059021]|uniref:hypothetical protein n=1 Tax=Amycolatopsis sp. NPDC059021 TaxID=3346704 RepID=UPI00366AB20B